MPTETFRAHVQYGDFKGTAAADRADQNDLADVLRAQGLMQEGETMLGVELWIGENRGEVRDPVQVTVLMAGAGDYETVAQMVAANNPVPVRRVITQMPLMQFMACFKRFSVAVSPFELMAGRQYRYQEE